MTTWVYGRPYQPDWQYALSVVSYRKSYPLYFEKPVIRGVGYCMGRSKGNFPVGHKKAEKFLWLGSGELLTIKA